MKTFRSLTNWFHQGLTKLGNFTKHTVTDIVNKVKPQLSNILKKVKPKQNTENNRETNNETREQVWDMRIPTDKTTKDLLIQLNNYKNIAREYEIDETLESESILELQNKNK